MKTANPERRAINQERGPTAGNTGTPEKRDTFIKEKSSGEKSALSNMILDAFKARGDGMKPHIERDVEGIHSNTNVGRGPTKGNAGKKK